jgi:hypothetical protein
MDKKELEKLINEMPFTDDEKKSLLVDLANGVSAQDILVKTKTLLATKEDGLNKENPQAAAVHEAAEREYEEAVTKASGEFDNTMVQIDKEAEEVGQEMMRRLDTARAEEIKESI